jgi:electron transport complex protein RnfE
LDKKEAWSRPRLARPTGFSRVVSYENGMGEEHPLLQRGAGAASIAAACTSAGSALTLTLVMLVLCLAMGVVYIYERGEYRQPMRTVLYLVPSAFITGLCALAAGATVPDTLRRIGMYLPLLAVDALVLSRLQADAPFLPPTQALPEALRLWWLYAVAAMTVGALREWLGQGTIFGWHLLLPGGIGGMNLAFAGFILLGFVLAVKRRRG